MGYAHGVLLKGEINTTIPAFYQHVLQEIDSDINFLPKEIADFISKYGLDGALDLTYEMTKDYIPSYFIEEIQGLANGSGVDYKLLLRAHMLPELVKVGLFLLLHSGTSLRWSYSGQKSVAVMNRWLLYRDANLWRKVT